MEGLIQSHCCSLIGCLAHALQRLCGEMRAGFSRLRPLPPDPSSYAHALSGAEVQKEEKQYETAGFAGDDLDSMETELEMSMTLQGRCLESCETT